ncbi:MAG: DUF6165 family protein [Candidatus Puniceispirillales bacterium]|jgi:hypothetical protein|tara:strand:+ start:3808 stop:4194 length:387 start_codon:yes stop_codon:yes gene_type:complete
MNINTIISTGEFFDKITILEIKKKKISDKQKLINIQNELSELRNIEKKYDLEKFELKDLINNLYLSNLKLWEIEDKIRLKEKAKEFDQDFIDLARSVYFKNDLRAKIKKDINIKSNSNLIEEKSYQEY